LEERGLGKGDFDKAQKTINDCRKSGLLPLDICSSDDTRAAIHLDTAGAWENEESIEETVESELFEIEAARQRAAEAKLDIRFETGSATDAPLADHSFDICLAPELLEHVADWRSCLSEFARILRPNGLLFVSTTNVLCPLQNEFTLPLYSWYPGPIKRYCERLAVTSRPGIANFATYPAVNWFTYYGLRKALIECGFGLTFDRFDISAMRKNEHGPGKTIALSMIRSIPPVRLLAYVLTKGTIVIAMKI